MFEFFVCAHNIRLGYGKELFTRFSVRTPCYLFICNLSYWLEMQECGSDCQVPGHCLSFELRLHETLKKNSWAS